MSESLSKVCQLLRHRGRSDLASLLSRASVDFEWADDDPDSNYARAVVRAAIESYDRLQNLGEDDQKAISAAILDVYPPEDTGKVITRVSYRLDHSSLQEKQDPQIELLQQIDRLRSLMIQVATGGPRINEVNADYRELFERVHGSLRELGIQNPNPYPDLWDWYGKWSSGDLPSYQSRREHIRGLFAPLEQQLREGQTGQGTEALAEPTGWPRVDRALGEIRRRLAEAQSEEQFQTVGVLCRETLISLAQTVYAPERHPATDGTTPGKADAKRMLDAYLAAELRGQQNEAARRHAKASLELANALQHKRTAKFREAALCTEATASVINIIAIVSGLRDPESGPASG